MRRVILTGLIMFVLGCKTMPVPPPTPEETKAAMSRKKTVAILNFREEAADVKGLGAVAVATLENMLASTGQVNLVERTRLNRILAEQNLAAEGMIDPGRAVKLGRLLGVDELIMGEVLTATLRGPFRNKHRENRKEGRFVSGKIWDEVYGVAKISVKTVDVETGLIGYSGIKQSKKNLVINSRSFTREADYQDALKQLKKDKKVDWVARLVMNLAKKGTTKDRLERQYRDLLVETMEKSVNAYRKDMSRHYALKAEVLKKVSEKTIMVNLGSASGIKIGDRLEVWHCGEPITDPHTGITTVPKRRIGKIKIVEITSGLTSIAKGSKKVIQKISVGDMVLTP